MLRLAFSRTATATARTPSSIKLPRTHLGAPRNFSATMAKFNPNTEPPKGFAIFKNVNSVAEDSDKFRRVLWTGTHSQVCTRSTSGRVRA